ncbi:hypothetical protein Tco_0405632 [Tanacetum coccineum]
MAGALGARTTARNLEPLMRDGGGQEEGNGNGGNGNGGNGNGKWRNGMCIDMVELHREQSKLRADMHELGRTYEVDDRSVLSKKRGSKDRDRVVELGCEGK